MSDQQHDTVSPDDGDNGGADTPQPDAESLRDAHGKLGSYLRKAGLPFEEDEFDEELDRASARDWPVDDDDDDNAGFEESQRATGVAEPTPDADAAGDDEDNPYGLDDEEE